MRGAFCQEGVGGRWNGKESVCPALSGGNGWGGASAPGVAAPPRGRGWTPTQHLLCSGHRWGGWLLPWKPGGLRAAAPEAGDVCFLQEGYPAFPRPCFRRESNIFLSTSIFLVDLSANPVLVKADDGCTAGVGHGGAPGSRQGTSAPPPTLPGPQARRPAGEDRSFPGQWHRVASSCWATWSHRAG